MTASAPDDNDMRDVVRRIEGKLDIYIVEARGKLAEHGRRLGGLSDALTLMTDRMRNLELDGAKRETRLVILETQRGDNRRGMAGWIAAAVAVIIAVLSISRDLYT